MKFHCCELQRLEVLQRAGSDNAIEFLEVRDHLEPDPLLRQRTLFVRLRQNEANAAALAQLLLGSPAVARVFYPGLAAHPGHGIARRQQRGFGGMLSFELKGGEAAARELLGRLRLFTLGVSLGGVESLSCHPATMTHLPLGPKGRRAAGISDGLVRLSAGIEATDDLVADLRDGLAGLG